MHAHFRGGGGTNFSGEVIMYYSPRASMEGLNEIGTAISSENIQLLQSYIATYRKKLEEVIFVEEEFLYKKISKKDLYLDQVPRLISHKMQLSSMEI